MKTVKANGISWFLDDEALVPAVSELNELRDKRRGYRTIRSANGTVFAKYFLEEGIWGLIRNRVDPRGKKEYQIGKKLLSLSIVTPNPVGYGLGRFGSFVLQEWIEARPFKTAFADQRIQPKLLGSLARMLSILRATGIRHNDLHLDNILVEDEKLYVIDLHKTKIKKRRFLEFDGLINLVHALGRIYGELTEEQKIDFFQVYGRPGIRPAFERSLIRHEIGWVDRKKARAFSTTSKLTKIGNRVYAKGSEKTGEGVFVECIKNDRKVRVERHSDHIRKVYRNNRRLNKAWRNHVVIEYLGLRAVPRPLYVQKGTLFRWGFIALEDLREKGEELDRFLDRTYDEMDERQLRGFEHAFSQFLVTLLKKRVLHMDFKACNVFALHEGFNLIDVEDFVFRRFSETDVVRMLVQLNTSIPVRISSTHRIRFYHKLAVKLGFSKPERKRIFKKVKDASEREPVIYVGVEGDRKESWTDQRT